MGMAHNAPYDNYRRTLGITDHAIERLREQLAGDTTATAALHRSDEDLGNMIDDAVVDGLQRNDFESVSDRGQAIKLVRLEKLPTAEKPYALVKENGTKDVGRGRMEFVVVTLYSEGMMQQRKASGRWRADDAVPTPVVHQKGGKMASAVKINAIGAKLRSALDLAEMKGTPVVPVTAAPAKKAPARAPAPPAAVPAVAALKPAGPPPDALAQRLVTYQCHGAAAIETAMYQAGELRQRLAELYDDASIDTTTIRVWREVKATAKVRVEFEIEE